MKPHRKRALDRSYERGGNRVEKSVRWGTLSTIAEKRTASVVTTTNNKEIPIPKEIATKIGKSR